MPQIDPAFADLLERPIIGELATVRPDGLLQVNPMWFQYDGSHIRFSHTSTRAKFRNLQSNSAMTLLVVDPDNTQRYIELRGRLSEIVEDPTGNFHQVLGRRYGEEDTPAPPDAADRVILVMAPEVIRTR